MDEREEEWRRREKERDEREEERRMKMAEEEEQQRGAQEEKKREEEEQERGMQRDREEEERRNAHFITLLQERLQQTERERDGLKEEIREIQSALKDKAPPTLQSPAPSTGDLDSLSSLRSTLVCVRRELVSRDDVIAGLSRDLAQAHARMTDMTGELGEQHKCELERHRVLVSEQRVQLSALREKMSMMSQLVEQKEVELKQLKEEKRQGIESRKAKQPVKELEYPVDSTNLNTQQEVCALGDQSQQGLKVKGQRQQEVMRLQQEALSELQSRLATLGISWPIALLQQGTSQRKQLHQSHNATGQRKMMASMCGFPLSSAVLSEASLERTARLDMTDALELSEHTYLELAGALREALELGGGQLVGSAPLRHLSPGERERLASLRHADLELLKTRLALTHTQSQRTALQLQEAEREIHTLRQGQGELHQLRSRLESVCVELKREREEAALLKEALDRTHTHTHTHTHTRTPTRLQQTHTHAHAERTHTHTQRSRPCSATHTSTQRKALVVDRQNKSRQTHSSGLKSAHEEKLQELLRRRDYELDTLKKQLSGREEELTRVTSQLASAVTSSTPVVTSSLPAVTSSLPAVTSQPSSPQTVPTAEPSTTTEKP
ncbi:forkhead-associated domain-containing protein 1-like [Engraulis encrasicolus]|uniref:forkhead-associated domain-containing protein 1-like n=1 Tax=Engraulis encrasicolus TaxID=184585 RepID=UPI002FCF052C